MLKIIFMTNLLIKVKIKKEYKVKKPEERALMMKILKSRNNKKIKREKIRVWNHKIMMQLHSSSLLRTLI